MVKKLTAYIYKDSNVIENIASPQIGDLFLKNWNLSCKKEKIFRKKMKEATIVGGPAIFIELLSLGKLLLPVPWTETPYRNAREYISNSFEEAKTFFDQLPVLSESNLANLSATRKKYYNPQGRMILSILVDKPLSSSTIKKTIVEFLALEAVCGREHPALLRDEVHLEIGFMIFDMIKEKSDKSLFRIVAKMWERLRTTNSAKSNPNLVKKINTSLGLKPSADYVDGELIHHAVIGTYIDGELMPVHCFTTDKTEIISDRIVMYKSLIKFLRDVVNDKFKDAPRFGPMKNVPGFVHIVDKNTGNIINTLDVGVLGETWKVRFLKRCKNIINWIKP